MMPQRQWRRSRSGLLVPGGGGDPDPIPTDNLYAEFLFDSYSGSTVHNTGSGDDGALVTGTVIDTVNKLAGHNTIDLGTGNSTNSVGMQLLNSNNFPLEEAHTISLWFYRDVNWVPSANKYTSIFNKGSIYQSGSMYINVYERSASNDVRFQSTYGSIVGLGASDYATNWHHLLVDSDPVNDISRMFIDNTLVGSADALTAADNNTSYHFLLGYDYGNERSWRRRFGLLRIYTRLTTGGERLALSQEAL